MKKIVSLLIIVMFMFSLIGFVAAETLTDGGNYNFFKDLMHKANKNLGLFTSAGQARQCSINADLTITQTGTNHRYSYADLITAAGCAKGVALIDTFDSSWHFLNEYRSEDIFSTYDGLTKSDPGIIEVYCCPYDACKINGDCHYLKYGYTCNANYGSCYFSSTYKIDHTTTIMKCVQGNWVTQGVTASYGQENWCMTEGYKMWISQTGAAGCYASAPSGWCALSCGDGTCNNGETCSTCTNDCGACPILTTATCGDGTCNGIETCTSCAVDCGACANVTTCTNKRTAADLDCNSNINNGELASYIDCWARNCQTSSSDAICQICNNIGTTAITRDNLGVVLQSWAAQ